MADSIVFMNNTPENWDGLKECIMLDYTLSNKDSLLAILNSDISSEKKKTEIKKMDGGRTWEYLKKEVMPKLRYSKWIGKLQLQTADRDSVNTEKDSLTPVEDAISPVIEPAPEQTYQEYTSKKTRLALKTNMLYDLATDVNFAVEVPFNKHLSVLYEHHCPWWLSKDNMYCMQFLSIGGEFRWWFSPKEKPATKKGIVRDALTGHFLGLYGMGGWFDLQSGKEICYQGEFNSIGITYGYATPVAKWLNLEFSISAGYARIPYRHYIPTDDYQILVKDKYTQGNWKYFGPTKMEVSLVVPLMFKTKKGGQQ